MGNPRATPIHYAQLADVYNAQAQNQRHRPAALLFPAEGKPPAHSSRPRQVPTVHVRKLKDVRDEERKRKRDRQVFESSTRSIVNSGHGFPDTRTIYSVDRQRVPRTASVSVHDTLSLSGQPLRDTSSAHRYTPTGQSFDHDASNDRLDDSSTRECECCLFLFFVSVTHHFPPLHTRALLARIVILPAITTTQTSSTAHSPSLSPLTSSTSTLLKHQVLRKNLQTWSGWSSWKTVNGAKTVSGAAFDDLVNREEIDLLGTAPRETFLANLGQWPRYDHVDAKDKIVRWWAEVASLAPSSEAVRTLSVYICPRQTKGTLWSTSCRLALTCVLIRPSSAC